MPYLNRLLSPVAVKGALALLLVASCTAVASRRGEDFWATSPAEEAGPVGEAYQKPSAEVAAIIRRLGEKHRLAAAVVDGRLTLLEAAAGYRGLNEGAPAFNWELYRRHHPGTCDEERHCREVIAFVRVVLGDRGQTETGLADRLEAEVREHLDRGDLRPGAPTLTDRRGGQEP